MDIKKIASKIVGSILSFGIGFIAASAAAPAFGITRSTGVTYANTYSCNTGSCFNSSYKNLGATDCANFVSQALHASGLPMRNVTNMKLDWYHYHACNTFGCSYTFSPAWVNVTDLVNYLSGSGYISQVLKPSMGAKFSGATAGGGDVYVYDWGLGEGYSHVSYSTGKWFFADYFDRANSINYQEITGGSGDMMSQHSTNRDKAPWNYGYQIERDPTVRAKMRTMVLVIG